MQAVTLSVYPLQHQFLAEALLSRIESIEACLSRNCRHEHDDWDDYDALEVENVCLRDLLEALNAKAAPL